MKKLLILLAFSLLLIGMLEVYQPPKPDRNTYEINVSANLDTFTDKAIQNLKDNKKDVIIGKYFNIESIKQKEEKLYVSLKLPETTELTDQQVEAYLSETYNAKYTIEKIEQYQEKSQEQKNSIKKQLLSRLEKQYEDFLSQEHEVDITKLQSQIQ